MITREQVKQLKEFEKAVIENLERINASGALPEDTPDAVRVNMAIKTTANNIRFGTPEYRELFDNLKHFV